MTALLLRLLPDVRGKPLHEDEAVAGLIAMRPFGEMLRTVVLDRGGAPLHFVLAHIVFAVDASADALRSLSIVFALATIPVCYDLGRRLGGPLTGLTAAALAATSQLLLVYGTFGRMYSLFAFASAVAADLFVRALERPSRRTAAAAAAGALLPLAVHPFGVFLFGAEVVVAAALWRGRQLREALPTFAIALLAVPLILADVRLSDRYAPEAGQELSGGYSTFDAVVRALGGSAGGHGVLFVAFALAAAVGLLTVLRRSRPLASFFVLAFLVPPLALGIAGGFELTSDRLSPRHFSFLLPLWTLLVALGVTSTRTRFVLPAAAVIAAILAPTAVHDPRTMPTGERAALAAPARWVRDHVSPDDVIYPYSPLFLASLPEVREARAYPREPVALERATDRTSRVGSVLVSVPIRDPVPSTTRAEIRKRGVELHAFRSWLVLRVPGPFVDGRSALGATTRMLAIASQELADSPLTRSFVEQLRGTACLAVRCA
jgi:hypothetical protein